MRRIVWIAAALLIVVAIMGYAIFTMRNIEQVNQRRREKDAGNNIAVQIAATTATTSVWDMLRSTETSTSSGAGGSQAPAPDVQTGLPEILDSTEAVGSTDQELPSGFEEPLTPTEQTTAMTLIVQMN